MLITINGIGAEIEVEYTAPCTYGRMEDSLPGDIDYTIVGAWVEDTDEIEGMELADLVDASEKDLIDYLETRHDEIMEKIFD